MGPPPNRPAQPPQGPQGPQGPPPQQPPPRQPYRPPYPPPAQGPGQGPGQAPAQQPPYPHPPQQPPFQHLPYRAPRQHQQPRQQPPPNQPATQPLGRPPAPPPTRPAQPAQPREGTPDAASPRRRDVPKTSWLGRIVGGVVVLALGAATVVLSDLEVLPSDMMPAFVTDGQVGKVVTTRSFKVRVDKPFVARELVVQEYSFDKPKVLATSGVWLVVPAAVQAQLEPMQFEGATILAKSGKKYASSRRLSDAFQPGAHGTSPGIAFLGSWAFEIPPEEIPGAKLLLSSGVGQPLLESEARVDLGAGADLVEKALPKYAFKKDDS